MLSPVSITNPEAGNPILLICEHASQYIPPEMDGLGLSEEEQSSHIAWDPGALSVASKLSGALDATLVSANYSRLLYDCNRSPASEDAIPIKSELFEVPGNKDLSEEKKAERVLRYYEPFRDAVAATINSFSVPPTLITVHSFTPVYFGKKRAVELGILHDRDTRLADAMLAASSEISDLDIRRNEPYKPDDGVTHTLRYHGIANNLKNVMLEIRNDLISSEVQCQKMAEMLYTLIKEALHRCDADQKIEGGS